MNDKSGKMSKENKANPFAGIEISIPFHKHLGIKVIHFEKGKVNFLLPFRDEFIGNYVSGFYHGGVLSASMDAVAGAAAGSFIYPDKGMEKLSTMDIRVDYMKPVHGRDIHIHGEVTSAGKRSIFVRMYITYVGEDKALVEGRAVMNIRA